ncbi:peptide chain release factor N(5)-glutamine methyltransferase [Nitratireductor basaltis]|nr:peptide chain release factor N(5)-glutamine methyltransferase [Nitratireductor basaltis]
MGEGELPDRLGSLLVAARKNLEAADVDDPALEARILVEHFTGTSRLDVLTSPDRQIGEAQRNLLKAALSERVEGKPVYRIIGRREFYGLPFDLSPDTLEPRPDTEALVELALPIVRRAAAEQGKCRILDLGTGTGAIALALINAVPQAEAVATDISSGALETAQRNADMHGNGNRFFTCHSNWFEHVEGRFDLIVSNPPYIPTTDVERLDVEVREHDPLRALDGGADGLDPYRIIAEQAADHLGDNGRVAVEIGYTQKSDVENIFTNSGYVLEQMARDLGKRDRAMLFRPLQCLGRP